MIEALESLFKLRTFDVLTPCLAAMAETVSPDLTVYRTLAAVLAMSACATCVWATRGVAVTAVGKELATTAAGMLEDLACTCAVRA